MPFLKNRFLKIIYFANKYSIFPLGKIKLTGLQVPHLEGFCQLHSRQAESKFDRRCPGRLSEISASSRLSQPPCAGWKGGNTETLSAAASSWKAVVNPPSLQAGSNTEESRGRRRQIVILLQFRWDRALLSRYVFLERLLMYIYFLLFLVYIFFLLSFCFSLNSGEML